MNMGSRIRHQREVLGWSQERLGEAVGVSFQAVSAWERDVCMPDVDKLPAIAAALRTSVAYLMGDEETSKEDGGRLFHEDRMYTFIKAAATAKGLEQTLRALPFAREKHAGQFRKGKERIPYISHPLTMCCHALALGLDEDVLLAATLLHDVIEDCDVGLDELPVSEEVCHIVRLLTKDPDHEADEEGHDRDYFAAIRTHPKAMLVKLMDRCHNLSVMSMGFPPERMLDYTNHTQEYVLLLADVLRTQEPQYSNACFLLKYQMLSLLSTVRHILLSDN